MPFQYLSGKTQISSFLYERYVSDELRHFVSLDTIIKTSLLHTLEIQSLIPTHFHSLSGTLGPRHQNRTFKVQKLFNVVKTLILMHLISTIGWLVSGVIRRCMLAGIGIPI